MMGQQWQYGVGGGMTLFKGDLSDWHLIPNGAQLAKMSPALNFQLSYQEKNAFAYRINIGFTSLQGDATLRPLPMSGFSRDTFSSSILEFAALADYNFLDYQQNTKIVNWTPYLYGGISAVMVSTSGSGTTITDSFTTLGLPFGIGVKYQINRHWGIQAQLGATKVLNDLLDGTSSNGNLDKITIAQTDQYLQTSLTVSYSIISIFCPKE